MSLFNNIQNLFSPPKSQTPPAVTSNSMPQRYPSTPPLAKPSVRQVFSKNGEVVTINTPLAKGGEGTIHSVCDMPGRLVKIYHDHILSNSAKSEEYRAKIEAMCSFGKWTKNEPFCWPRIPVFDNHHRWVGYAMRKGQGEVIQLLCNHYTVTKEFPGWDRADLLLVVISIAEGLDTLHNKGVLVGDVSTGNYLADPDSRAVSFVDCDSYHIHTSDRNFPCTVRTKAFSPPEVISGKVTLTDLTPEQERFSAAILFFYILMLGFHPFSHVGGGTPMNNIVTGRCALGKNNDAQFSKGPWRNIWSHLPYKVKDLFIRCFRDGHCDPNQRPELQEWLGVLRTYHYEMTQRGYHDRSLRPNQPKSNQRKGVNQNHNA